MSLTAEQILTTTDWTKTIPVAVMLKESGFCKSRGEGRRMIEQGAVKINDCKVTDKWAFIANNGQFTIIVQDGGNDINITTVEK